MALDTLPRYFGPETAATEDNHDGIVVCPPVGARRMTLDGARWYTSVEWHGDAQHNGACWDWSPTSGETPCYWRRSGAQILVGAQVY